MDPAKIKEEYEKGEEFIYRLSNEVSFCPICGYPVIITCEKSPRKGCCFIVCVNDCFKFHVRRVVFNKFSMDNIMDLYKKMLERDDEMHIRFMELIDFGDDMNPQIGFTCCQCIANSLREDEKNDK
jgi:hypothetical protein